MINESPFRPGAKTCECACAIDLGQLAIIFIMDVSVFLFLCWLFRKEIMEIHTWLIGRFNKPGKPKGSGRVKIDESHMVDSGFAGNHYGGGRREP